MAGGDCRVVGSVFRPSESDGAFVEFDGELASFLPACDRVFQMGFLAG